MYEDMNSGEPNRQNENSSAENMQNSQNTGNSSMNAGSTGNNNANGTADGTGYNTGNGSYQYGQGTSENSSTGNGQYNGGYGANGAGNYNGNGYNSTSGNGYHNPYSSSYGSNPVNGGNAAGHTSGGNAGGNKPHKKWGAGAKAALAVALAAIFGICAGVGAYGVRNVVQDRQEQAQSKESSSDSATLKSSEDSNSTAKADADTDNNNSSQSDSASTEQGAVALTTAQDDTASTVTDVSGIVAKAMPSIVSVYNNFTESGNFMGQTYSQQETATGSGIIVAKTDTELLIATNNHVVESADSLKVQFIDNKTANAAIKGTDSSNDLAVIAVNLSDISSDTLDKISVATIGDSDALKVGEPAIAIGNALGYGQSVTTGVISALNREIQMSDTESNTFIQTDAAINPGNSGGALLNSKGEVIGINSNKIGATEVEGMGYAIPMSRAEPIITKLMNQETKTKVSEDEQGYLGISGVSVTEEVASAYSMPEGVYVAQIIDGGGAADSDLAKGDIITAVNDTSISSMDDLKAQLEYYKAGTEITLTVQRQDGSGSYKETSVKVKLGDKSTVQSGQQSSSDSQNGQSGQDAQNSQNDQNSQNSGDQSGADPFAQFFGNGQN
jgi:serine protease Do